MQKLGGRYFLPFKFMRLFVTFTQTCCLKNCGQQFQVYSKNHRTLSGLVPQIMYLFKRALLGAIPQCSFTSVHGSQTEFGLILPLPAIAKD